eukprot:jgi/Ulvmu1/256/UM001_0260.1
MKKLHGNAWSCRPSLAPRPRSGNAATGRVICKSADPPVAEDISDVDVAWDPANLLKADRLSKGHIEKRLAERKAKMIKDGPRNMIITLAGEEAGPDGIKFSDIQNTVNGRPYADHVDVHYMGIGDDFHDRIQVLNIDPPVFVIDDFLPKDLCSNIIASTTQSELLQRSKIGGGVLTDEGLPVSQTRTSSSLLIDADVQESQPALKDVATQVQDQIKRLFPFCAWGETGVMPKVGKYAFEGLQVANYQSGQYFRSHEDGFPHELAGINGFQRRATVLMYLNDVEQGGRTKFDWLDVSVQPAQGRALIFFPALRTGLADDRTLHTAEDAADEKWVCQQWCVCGVPQPAQKGGKLDQLATLPMGKPSNILGSMPGGGSASRAGKGVGAGSSQQDSALSDAERMALTAKHSKRVKRKQAKSSAAKGSTSGGKGFG